MERHKTTIISGALIIVILLGAVYLILTSKRAVDNRMKELNLPKMYDSKVYFLPEGERTAGDGIIIQTVTIDSQSYLVANNNRSVSICKK